MTKTIFSWEKFLQTPIVGISRGHTLENLIKILPLYTESGLNTIEITMDTPYAVDLIRFSKKHFDRQLNIGAGTVCNLHELNLAIEAGAQFIVTPILNEQVISSCIKQEIPVFTGAFSPTEIYKAWSQGASIVKVFPATSVGPKFIKDIKGPLPKIKLMPTGGVSINNITDFLDAGATSFGVGSELFNKVFIKNRDWNALKNHFELYVKKIRNHS